MTASSIPQPLLPPPILTASPVSTPSTSTRGLLPTLFAGVFMAALDTAVVGPVLPALRAAFGIDHREASLVTIVFVLFSLASTAPLANLSDRIGRRAVYLACLTGFALGSLLIALAPGFGALLVGRAMQGLASGGIVPVASAVIGDVVPFERQGRALGLIGAVFGMAFVLGPPLAGVVMVVLDWRWIFLVNLPIAAVVIFLGARVLPGRPANATRGRVDVAGVAIVFLLLAALVLGITRVADASAGLTLWPGFLAAAALLLPALVATERAAAQPMIPLSLFANRQLAITYVLTAGAGFGMGSVVFLPSIATLAHGVSPSRAGFVLLPLVLCSMAGSVGSGRMLNPLGARTLIVSGFVLLALGYAAIAVTRFGLAAFLAASVPIGLGVGVIVGGATRSIAIDEAPARLRGSAQGLINIFSGIGTLLSAANIGAIADFRGGGAAGFGVAYLTVAALMAAMLALALALRRERGGRAAAQRPRSGAAAERVADRGR